MRFISNIPKRGRIYFFKNGQTLDHKEKDLVSRGTKKPRGWPKLKLNHDISREQQINFDRKTFIDFSKLSRFRIYYIPGLRINRRAGETFTFSSQLSHSRHWRTDMRFSRISCKKFKKTSVSCRMWRHVYILS